MSSQLKYRLLIMIIGLLPIILLLIGYVVFDPFKVIHHYADYSNARVILDRDFVSTQSYIDRRDKNRYDSFIFGSSRTVAFQPKTWEKYLQPPNRAFLFDASSESVYGIHLKIKYLDRSGAKLNNVIILLCRDCSFGQSRNSIKHLSIKHPALTGESKLAFHSVFFRAYMNPLFLASFYTYRFGGKYFKWMKDYIELRNISYDVRTNQSELRDIEDMLRKDPNQYYKDKMSVFYSRGIATQDSIGRITTSDRSKLLEIKQILAHHRTSYHIVLSPLYDQVQFSETDLKFLNDTFPGRVHDFSGKNEFTDNITNYYESSHYRPHVGEEIMRFIYSDRSLNDPDAKE